MNLIALDAVTNYLANERNGLISMLHCVKPKLFPPASDSYMMQTPQVHRSIQIIVVVVYDADS